MIGALVSRASSGYQLNSPLVSCSAYLSTRWASAGLNRNTTAQKLRGRIDGGSFCVASPTNKDLRIEGDA